MGTTQGKGMKSDCIICLEKHLKGTYCQSKEHFICDNCFLLYVESVFNDAGKLIDTGCRVHCPDPNCTSPPLTTTELRKLLPPEIFEKYFESLITLVCMLDSQDKGVEFDGNDLDTASKVVIDAMSILCPSCHIALDPNPDGCCAIRCGTCSKYLCLLCLKIEPNSVDCHIHVRLCPQNPSKNVFAPPHVRKTAHKRLQIRSIQQKLRSKYGPNWRSLPSCKTILQRCQVVLSASDITAAEIIRADADEGSGGGSTSHPPAPNQPAQPQPFDKVFYGFLFGLFVMYLSSSMQSYFSSSSTPQSCPSLPETFDLEDSFEFSIDDDDSLPETPSLPFSFWLFFVYLFKGCCYALALNFFTRQALVEVPLLGILAVLLWYPVWIIIYSLFSLLFLVLYYLIFVALYHVIFSVAVLLTLLMVVQGFKQKGVVTALTFWGLFLLCFGMKTLIG
jgi:hypothetical protein